MRSRPLVHRLRALMLGVLALQLTLWGERPACSPASITVSGRGHSGLVVLARPGVGEAEHVGIVSATPGGAAEQATMIDKASAGVSASEAHGCSMPARSGGCAAPRCAAEVPTPAALESNLVVVSDAGRTRWPDSRPGPNRSLVPDVPPPRA